MTFQTWYLLLILILGTLAITVGTITSRSFWKVVRRRKKCRHCYGAGFVEHVGEGLIEECEHCNPQTK